MNEWYLRNCSRKQCAAYQTRGNAGKPTTNHATHNSYDESRPCDWSNTTVSNILSKPEYMGHTVNFRSYKESYKDKHAIKRPPEEWTVFEDTHEAIVDPETWKLAQQIRKTVKRTDTTGAANPLTGLVFCADCGAKMYNHRKKSFSEKGDRGIDPITELYPYDSYECSTYSLTFNRSQKEYGSHYTCARDLRALLLDTIRTVSAYAISNEAEFIERVRASSEVRQAQAAKDLKRKLSNDRRRSVELDGLIKKLYESYATEKISEKRFELLSGEYEREQERAVDVRTVDPETPHDIRNVTVRTDLPQKEQILDFIRQIGNPYCYRHGKYIVKISFADTDVTLEERMLSYLRSNVENFDGALWTSR